MEAQIELAQKKSEKTSGYDKNGNREKPQLDPVKFDFVVWVLRRNTILHLSQE